MKSGDSIKTERLLGIVLLLSTRGRISCREMAEMFEVSLRTIYRDVDSLNLAGVPVRTTPGPNGGVELEEGYHRERCIFSGMELSRIVTALSASTSLSTPDIHQIVRKVQALIPQTEQESFNHQAESVFLDLSPWNTSSVRDAKLRTIEEAIRSSCLLNVVYLDSASKETTRMIEPRTLVMKGLAWYLYAWCRLRNGFRVFRISRMKNVIPTDIAFVRRDIDVGSTPWNDIWQRADGAIKARIRFDEVARSLMSECFPEEDFLPDGEDWHIVTVTAPTVEWLCGFILSLETHALLLEPQEVKDRITATVRSILNLYEA